MVPEELTLIGIDGMRDHTVNEQVVNAVAFATRCGHNNRTAWRFVTALAITDNLAGRDNWPQVLMAVMDLESTET
jgi:hypothetical protein